MLPPRVLETIPLDAIDSKGYAFQIETTYRVRRAGFRVVEIPIAFTDREHGDSKMNGAIVLEAVWKVPLLRLRALGGPALGRGEGAALRTAPTPQIVSGQQAFLAASCCVWNALLAADC